MALSAQSVVGGVGVLAAGKWLLKSAPEVAPDKLRTPDPTTDWKKKKGFNWSLAPKTGERYLVIGTGSVGLCIVEALIQRGETVTGFDVVPPKRNIPGARFITGSVTDYASLREACQNVDVVYATVALIRYYERLKWQYKDSHAVNVVGTENIIRACVECGVKILVQTSTAHVVMAADRCSRNMDEETPMVDEKSAPNHYGWTKVQAERAVAAANGEKLASGERLRTGCIRPCSAIFGPEDNFITEKFLREGTIQQFISWNDIDYVFVENIVWGHLLLERALRVKPGAAGGQAFCISNNEPIVSDNYYRSVKFFYEQATGESIGNQYLPYRLLAGISYFIEGLQWLFRFRLKGDAANLTGAMIELAMLDYAFSSDKAKRILGYEPLFTVDEGVQRTVHLFMERKKAKRVLEQSNDSNKRIRT